MIVNERITKTIERASLQEMIPGVTNYTKLPEIERPDDVTDCRMSPTDVCTFLSSGENRHAGGTR
jgi:hypothetical protein